MRKKKIHTIIFLMLFLFSGMLMNAAVTAADYSKPPILVAYLSGNQMVPQVHTSAQGKVVFQLSDDGEELFFKIDVSDIKDITAAHIHVASEQDNGRVVVVLFDFDNPGTGKVNSTVMEGTITSAHLVGPLVGRPLENLLREMEEGYAYINVHTKEYPQGYIRGQIIDPFTLPD